MVNTLNKQELKAWKSLTGKRIKSFTDEDKTYTVFFTKEGLKCDCPDFLFRNGSRLIEYKEKGTAKKLQGCKHMFKFIVEHLDPQARQQSL